MTIWKFVTIGWRMMKQDPLVMAPSLIFFLLLHAIEAIYLKNFTFDRVPTSVEIFAILGVLVLNVFFVTLNTSMGLSLQESGHVEVGHSILETCRAFVSLVLLTLLCLLPLFCLFLGGLWATGTLVQTIPPLISALSVVGQIFLMVIIMILVLILQFFPVMALDRQLNWLSVPATAAWFVWSRLRYVIVFTALVYFIKFLGLLASVLFVSIPFVGESLFLAFFRAFSHCLTVLMTVVFYLGMKRIDSSSVVTSA